MSLIDDLNNKEQFTKAELPIINYILENGNDIINMSIGQLAKATYSSNPVIIRLAKKLGFSGYKEFKTIFAMNIEAAKYINNDTDYTLPFSKEETTLQIINSMSNLYKNTIDLINSHLDIKELQDIARVLINGRNVFVFATGDTCITAQGFVNKLVKVGKFFHLANINGEQSSFSKHSKKDDVCLFITYNSNLQFLSLARDALLNGSKVIVITGNKDSKLAKLANIKIIIPHQEEDRKIATFYSQHAFSYILNILYAIIYQRIDS